MNCVELFSGSSDLSNELRRRGHLVLDVDWDKSTPALWHRDISNLTLDDLRSFFPQKRIDFIWASPDCTTYSRLSLNRHRSWDPPYRAVSPLGHFCDSYNFHLWDDILLPSRVRYIVENPSGRYKYMPFVKSPYCAHVHYSDFGGPTFKPTDYFTNCFGLDGFLGSYGPRKFGSDLQRLPKGCLVRSRVPYGLIVALCDFIEGSFE